MTNQTFLASSLLRTADAVAKPRGPLVGMTKEDMRKMLADLAPRAQYKTPAKWRTRSDQRMEAAAKATTMRPAPTRELNLHRPKGGTPCARFADN
ncbi:hypothetical protein UFOVP1064_4 [uncultured Caudovirales phage]|uniref:Uncharacterized protein n=1 Tax=uncultured Caudovirales phage TaxID=2100421 RepID=A0A6J5QF02_9CAUD|nr:hypothetical protein UFOVP659_71 [uncultured Caudovirales phage]CAB4169513.1 hypothetical protein UFOVP885_50 [uncultured Caudovirales phage]CAB4180956.1 hypothetical protein UFOVP1064_4 [uncultured Caudovirales phage]CAB4190411.1 hypothetical protein UFOVP1197_59 [uncultured Caudovirales phage]CAB4195675.1 hypothetical protein UFOVP1294_31 [uncultured Caudovirales phage]